jgi:hypothetical protein
MTRRLHAVLALLLVFGLSARADAGRPAQRPVKNQKLSDYARTRQKNQASRGTFTKLADRNKLVRTRLRGNGFANPSRTGASRASIAFRPSRGSRPGSLTVEIPEFYVGSSMGGTTTERQLFATDIRGNSVPVTGKLVIGANSAGRSFVKAKFVGTIPSGACLSQTGIQSALKSLQVHEARMVWTREPKAASR